MNNQEIIDKVKTDLIKEFTVKQVFEALKQNGFAHLRATWQDTDRNGRIVAGCVLAQTGFNLGVAYNSELLVEEMREYIRGFLSDEDYFAIRRSDEWYKAVDDIRHKNIESEFNRFEYEGKRWKVEDRRCGSLIIYWNDLLNDDGEYKLKTYEDVAKMAGQVLKPHMNKKVHLAVRQFSFPADVAERVATLRANIEAMNA
jgi:hypothetical protein